MPNGPPPKIDSAMATTSNDYPAPPGQERPLPKPTKTGRIPFTVPGTGEHSETYYILWGDLSSGKTPLICLHGGPGVAHNYLLPISLVHEDYGVPVIMYDQIGCGLSTHFKEKKYDTDFWTPQLFMTELDNLKAKLGIKEFDLLGQSWGGMMGGQYAITQPKGLRKLLVCDSPASMVTWMKVCNQLREALPKEVQETLTRCEKNGTTETKEYKDAVTVFYRKHVCRVWPYPKELNDSDDQLDADNTVYETMNGPSEFYVVGSLKTWSIEKDLHKITTETVPGGIFLANGYFDEAQDECQQPFFTEPKAKVKWVRFGLSSHTPQLEETEKFIKAVGDFLTKQ